MIRYGCVIYTLISGFFVPLNQKEGKFVVQPVPYYHNI
jgi:hypothetical protein